MEVGSRRIATEAAAGPEFALVLGGGGALGAFQAGVYEALEETGMVPSWLAGTSISALNAGLIAGNPPARRLERLRAFWDLAAEPGVVNGGWSGDFRRVAKSPAGAGQHHHPIPARAPGCEHGAPAGLPPVEIDGR